MSNLNLNKVILGGRLTADVELKQTASGVSVCSFSLAVNRKYTRESEQQTDFISCVAWRGTAEFIAKYFRKGSSICVWGSIQTRSWQDSTGNKKFATEVVVDEAMFVDSKNGTQQADTAGAHAYIPEAYTARDLKNESDDDLPF